MAGFHLENSCLQNFKVSGKGVLFNNQVPPGVFVRVVQVDFNYEINVPSFYKNRNYSDILLQGKLKLD